MERGQPLDNGRGNATAGWVKRAIAVHKIEHICLIAFLEHSHRDTTQLVDPVRPFGGRLAERVSCLLKVHQDLIERLRVLRRFNQVTPHINDFVDVFNENRTFLFTGPTGGA